MKRKKLLIAGILLLLFLCCGAFLLPRLQGTSVETTDEAFERFTHTLFLNEVSSNALTLHYTLSEPERFGITDVPSAFCLYSKDSSDAAAAGLENTRQALSAFSREELSDSNRLTYDILSYQFEKQAALLNFPYYEEILSPTLGTQAQLPILLAEYTFRSEQDIENYISLLSTMDAYYQSLMDYEREKAKAGLFMSDETAEAVISQCQAFLSNPGEHFLLSTFEERIDSADFLSEEKAEEYLASNRTVFFGHVVPAYELLIQGLTELKGSGKNPYGLCYYEKGSDYYEALTAAVTGTGRDMEEILLLIEEQLDTDLETVTYLVSLNPEILTSVSRQTGLTEPAVILKNLQQEILEDFPSAPSVSCQVKYVDSSLEKYLSPAFYLTPPLDRMNEHVIYINPANHYDSLSLYTTLAHEGWPGHLYQTLYENSCELDPVRNLFNFGGYTEGWATYVEWLSYSYAIADQEMAELLAANGAVSLGLHARTDVGIHYEGWSLEDTEAFFAGYGVTNPETVYQIYQAVIQDPGNYLKYYLGAAEILKLEGAAEEALSERFVLKDFHTFFLSMGPAPFPVIEDYMERWLSEQ
ncbi:MAG: DUF885 domain-containing protein [Lachnospiraceae bacterium]|nr:DUF885 domain-containing protein [Lachnospiraceae bacterium]